MTAAGTARSVKNVAGEAFRNRASKAAGLARSTGKAAYYNGTKAGRREVSDRLWEADNRTAERTYTQRQVQAKRASVANQHGGSVRAAKKKRKGSR